MVYGILNFVFAALLLWLSYYTDRKMGNKDTVNNPIIVMNTMLMFACVMMGLTIFFSLSMLPERLTTFLGRCMYLFMGMYSINYCVYCVTFPSLERGKLTRIFTTAGYVICAWILFTKVTAINITGFLGIRVEAKSLFTSFLLSSLFTYNWYNFYEFFLTFCLPSLSVIIMLLRSENRTSRLDHQKTIITASGLIFSWICMHLILNASDRVALFSSVVLAGFITAQAIVVMAATTNFLYDLYTTLNNALKALVCYVAPALFVGILFPFVWKLYANSKITFFIIIALIIIIASFASHELLKLFKKVTGFQKNQYESILEEEFAQMDYSDDPSEIVKKMDDIFVKNVGATSFRVLIDMGNDEIESVYDKEGESRLVFNMKSHIFDSLLNMNAQVVLKNSVESGYFFMSIKDELMDFFKKTKSDVMIILNEGRHIIGLILLGERAGGNIYSDYDLMVLKKLYSYMFVFGYYMKNIGNQEIVGTVNREIHMSEQIIGSIQGNMDPIKNKKYDIGNLMIHAHNIGGEFIDLIKLGEDRHVFVLGDLSGKGISASMSMVIVKSIIRTYLADASDFKVLVEKVNKFIRFNLPKGTFFEGVFGLIDFKDNTIYYINCGVPAMFLYSRAYNNIIEIQGEGHVLGFVKDIAPYIKVKKVNLTPGDILVACTDGILDSHSLRGEQFGKDRIQKCITENTSLSAQNIAETAYSHLVEFVTTELEDDVSIFVMKMGK